MAPQTSSKLALVNLQNPKENQMKLTSSALRPVEGYPNLFNSWRNFTTVHELKLLDELDGGSESFAKLRSSRREARRERSDMGKIKSIAFWIKYVDDRSCSLSEITDTSISISSRNKSNFYPNGCLSPMGITAELSLIRFSHVTWHRNTTQKKRMRSGGPSFLFVLEAKRNAWSEVQWILLTRSEDGTPWFSITNCESEGFNPYASLVKGRLRGLFLAIEKVLCKKIRISCSFWE